MSGPDRNRGEGASPEDEMDAFDRLRAADPVDPDTLPTADSPHARALYKELTMPVSSSPTSRRRRVAGAGAIVSILAVLAIGVVVVAGGPDETGDPAPLASGDSTPSTEPGSPPGMATCVETYSLETLANREVAFDGTLTAIQGDQVTFEVNEVFAGDLGDTVVLGGAGIVTAGSTASSVEGPTLAVGDRALVAGDGGFAWGCGFTQPHDPDVAEQWRDTLG